MSLNGAKPGPLEPDYTHDIFDNISTGDKSPLFHNTLEYNSVGFNQPSSSWDYPFPTDLPPFDNFAGYNTENLHFQKNHFDNTKINNDLFLPDVPNGSAQYSETSEHKETKEISLGVPQTILALEDPDTQTMTSILEILVKAKIKVTVSSTGT
ncbi:hypothetical protein EAF04_007789 [Stromatinia cepivora]|nr:hypothetical protein EAF04_007789 [Stromatinia cepivora]